MNDLFALSGLGFIGSILGLAGGIIFLFLKPWSEFLRKYSIPFAAGVLITVSLTGILPEAVDSFGENAFLVTLLSFMIVFVFETFFIDIHHHDGETHFNKNKRYVPLIIIGDTIHNFIDGVAIAAAYFINPGLGLVTAISTLLHEIPHEIGDFGLLLKAGWRRRNILIVNLLSAFATFLGLFFVTFFTQNESIIGFLLSIAGGIFLYLGASDFLPSLSHDGENKNKSIAVLLLGVLIMTLIIVAIPHNHEEDNEEKEGTAYVYNIQSSSINK